MSSTRLPRKKSKQRPTGFFRQVKNSKKKKNKGVCCAYTHIHTHTHPPRLCKALIYYTFFFFLSATKSAVAVSSYESREREREAKRPEREKDKGAQLYRVRGRVQNRSSSDTVQQVKKKKLQLPKREIQQTINQRQVRGSCGLRRFSLIRLFLQNNKNEVNEP